MALSEDPIDENGPRWGGLAAFRDRALLEDSDDLLHPHHSLQSDEPSVEVEYMVGEAPAAIYLRDISRVKLLTADQEVEYAKAIEQGRLAREARSGAPPPEGLDCSTGLEELIRSEERRVGKECRL